jgi:hypothetical protein
MTSEAAFLATFPAPTLTPIGTVTTQPTYLTIETAQRELNANAISVHSYDGGGLNGHLALTLTPAAYLAIAGVPYVPPPAPTAEPVFANDAPTGPQITEANRLLLARQKTFKLYHDVDRALVRQILAATPVIYLQALNDRQSGFSHVTTRQMLTHLRTHYGQVTMEMKDDNTNRMMAAWQPPTPIDTLFQQLDDGIYFATAAGEPLVDTAVARIGYNIIHKTGVFSDACRDWCLQEPAAQTYVNFQVHFRKMDNYRRVNATTSTSAGYQMANHVGSHPSTSPSTTSSFSSDPTILNAEIASLRVQLALATMAPPGTPSTNRHQLPATRGYCWTHGSSGNLLHTSASCTNPAPGHQTAATNRNRMGGSARRYRRPTNDMPTPVAAAPIPVAATPPAPI